MPTQRKKKYMTKNTKNTKNAKPRTSNRASKTTKAAKAVKRVKSNASKLKNMTPTHGKTVPDRQQTLAELRLREAFNPYNTLELEKYQFQLSEMIAADLNAHAMKVGVIPSPTKREQTVKKLLSAFKIHASKYKRAEYESIHAQTVKNRRPISDEMKAILSQGR